MKKNQVLLNFFQKNRKKIQKYLTAVSKYARIGATEEEPYLRFSPYGFADTG
jgi:hypothetical protein